MSIFDSFLRMAKRGDKGATLLCASMLENGWSVPADRQAAIKLYETIAFECPLASLLLARLLTKDPEKINEAFNFAKMAADAKLAEASILLGMMHSGGIGTAVNSEAAIQSYERGAELGDPSGFFLLASRWINDRGVISDADKARPLLERAVSGGYHAAAPFLASILLTGDAPENVEKAIKILEAGAQQEDFGCLMKLSAIYGKGLPTVPMDKARSSSYSARALARAGKR